MSDLSSNNSPTLPDIDPESLVLLAQAARDEGRPADGRALLAQAVNLSRDLRANGAPDAEVRLAENLILLGKAERDLGTMPAATQHYLEAAALFREARKPLRLAHALRHAADIQREYGEPTPAAANYQEALLLYRDHPGARALDTANTLRGLAHLQAGKGHLQQAIGLWQEARAIYADLNVDAGVEESDREIRRLNAQAEPGSKR